MFQCLVNLLFGQGPVSHLLCDLESTGAHPAVALELRVNWSNMSFSA